MQADQTFHAPAFATAIDCVITREQASFPAGGTLLITVTDPTIIFQSSAPFDYRLKRGSVAQDYCDTFFYSPVDDDIDNQPRGCDDPTRPNVSGAHRPRRRRVAAGDLPRRLRIGGYCQVVGRRALTGCELCGRQIACG